MQTQKLANGTTYRAEIYTKHSMAYFQFNRPIYNIPFTLLLKLRSLEVFIVSSPYPWHRTKWRLHLTGFRLGTNLTRDIRGYGIKPTHIFSGPLITEPLTHSFTSSGIPPCIEILGHVFLACIWLRPKSSM